MEWDCPYCGPALPLCGDSRDDARHRHHLPNGNLQPPSTPALQWRPTRLHRGIQTPSVALHNTHLFYSQGCVASACEQRISSFERRRQVKHQPIISEHPSSVSDAQLEPHWAVLRSDSVTVLWIWRNVCYMERQKKLEESDLRLESWMSVMHRRVEDEGYDPQMARWWLHVVCSEVTLNQDGTRDRPASELIEWSLSVEYVFIWINYMSHLLRWTLTLTVVLFLICDFCFSGLILERHQSLFLCFGTFLQSLGIGFPKQSTGWWMGPCNKIWCL